LYVAIPALYAAGWLRLTVIPVLLGMAAGCWAFLHWRQGLTWRSVWQAPVARAEWRRILTVYAAALPCLVGLLWLIEPGALVSLAAQRPELWLAIMVLYPIVSVLPQEIIYRVFFFGRYRPLFGDGMAMMLANALAFGLGHLIFHNWPSVALTFLGGWLFARTYQRTKSLRAVSVEHALYGCAIFTIGYGHYFYEGTLRFIKDR